MYKKIIKEIKQKSNPQKAKDLMWFFKTGKGQYGEGDIFLGITIPEQRKIAKNFSDLTFFDIQKLLNNKYHEYRMIALLILICQFLKANEKNKKQIYNFYLKNTKNINNWDLVDLTAPKIVGEYLAEFAGSSTKNTGISKNILYKLARSKHLWEKRIAIISTYSFIKRNNFNDTLKISEILLHDEHDLIHKAVGWMLREVGKRDFQIEENFLKKHYKKMPRMMLRYAIEKFPKELYDEYLNGRI